MHGKRAVAATVSLLLTLAVHGARSETLYALRDLGTLGGSAIATGVNNSGQMAGYVSLADGSMLPAVFGRQTSILPGGQGQAAGINNRGTIIGTTLNQTTPQATEWVRGQATPLSGLGGAESYGLAINNNNQAVGSAQLANGDAHAVIWNGNSVRDLGTLGGSWSAAYAISNSGHVTGTSETSTGSFEAFLMSGKSMSSLGTLGGQSSQGFAINDAGQVAGTSQTAAGYYHAFLSSGMSLLDLGTLGGTQSYAYGLNASGSVVGYSYTADGQRHAFLYTDGVMLDLNSLLPLSAGWTFTDAFGISDAGVIAGAALVDGVYHAFQLSAETAGNPVAPTPEPFSTFALGLVLVTGGVLYRWTRRAERLG